VDSRCPLKKKDYPTSPCSQGRKGVNCAKKGKEGGCPWFVASLESNFCFFSYLKDHGGRQMLAEKIAPLLMMGDEEVKSIITKFKAEASDHLDVRPMAANIPKI
jgi:hypothetical protein